MILLFVPEKNYPIEEVNQYVLFVKPVLTITTIIIIIVKKQVTEVFYEIVVHSNSELFAHILFTFAS